MSKDKSILLGSTDPIIRDNTKTIPFDVTKLLILEHKDSVINILCANCLTILEGSKNNAKALANAAKVDLPDDLTGKYFQTSSCLVCNNGREKKMTVWLKDVKELAN